ncbi:MAG: sigma factor, partial [Usitatibacter sp.]
MALRSLKAAELAAMTRFLRNYARGQLHNADQADDVVQEALAAALAPQARYDGRSTLRTWLVGILR